MPKTSLYNCAFAIYNLKVRCLMNLNEYLQSESDSSYYVDNIQNDESSDKSKVELIILCESPHKQEIIKKHPLAGKSGVDVAKFLFGESQEESIGEMVNNKSKKLKKVIAIINVSNVPLQVIDDNMTFLDQLSELTNLQDCTIPNPLLVEKLKNTLSDYSGCKDIIVCGSFAKLYFDAIKDLEFNATVHYVLHPSRNQWQKATEYAKELDAVKKLFE